MDSVKSDKFNLLKNKKILLGITALTIGLVVIFIFSFVPYTLNFENLKDGDFLTNLLIVCAIVILAMVSTIFIGQASNAQNPKSKLAKSTVMFIESKSKVVIKGIHAFKRWIQHVQQPNDIKTIKERYMSEVGIEDFSVLNLTIEEIRSLIGCSKIIKGVPYEHLTIKQYKVLENIKLKGIKIQLVPPEYYLSVKNLIDNRTKSERASAEGKKKSLTLVSSIFSKLILTVVFSIIFALFVRDVASQQSISETLALLFARLWSFTTSVFMGYIVGCQINDIDSEYIDMRVDTHLEFLEDSNFTTKTKKEEILDEINLSTQSEQDSIVENI